MRWVWRILGGIAALAVVIVLGALGYRAWAQHENAVAQEIHTPNGIVEESFVKIGGVEQWVQIRGQDRDNPVPLILSGGPGNSLIPLSYKFLLPWEKKFTVVNWDQRGSGLTYVHNNGGEGLTIPRMTEDTIELSDYLRKHLHKKKIVLLGWSWGSILGVEAAHARPDLFSAYIGTGQLVDGRDNEAVGYASLLKRAEASHDDATVKTLRDIGPPPWADSSKTATEREALIAYTPPRENAAWKSLPFVAFCAPETRLLDLNAVGIGAAVFSFNKLWPSVMRYDARHLGTQFDLPMFVIDGADDIQVPMPLARDWFATVQAPRKEFITIPGAAHLALATHSDEFLQIVDEKVRPLAVAADR